MINSLAFLSLLTSAVLAQSGTPTPTSASTANLIPTGISQSCTDFLTSLDQDTGLTTCTSSLLSITSAYTPGGNATTSPSSSQVLSTLNNLCSTSTSNSCPEGDMRTRLTQFYSQCSAELTSKPVAAVTQIYDVLYALTPFRTAICSKDDSGSFCATNLPASNGLKSAISAGSPALTPNDIIKALVQTSPALASRASTTALVPNITTYQNTDLIFLFLQPASGSQAALQSSSQCTACTRNIMTAYINFESDTPYAIGLAKSLLLAPQQTLYNAITNTCGKTFLSGVVQAAGGLSGGTLPSGAMRNVVTVSQGFVAVGMGVLAVVIFSFF